MFNKLLIWGTGGHSRVVAGIAESLGYKVRTIDDNMPGVDSGEWKSTYPSYDWACHVAIGDNEDRRKVSKRLKESGYGLRSIISDHAWTGADVRIEGGTFIGPMACVQVGTILGEGVIVNTGATVDHDCLIGAYAHIAPGANLCGSVMVGEETLIGVGASVIPDIRIAKSCIIAGNSSVNRNITEHSMWAGNPIQFKYFIREKEKVIC